MMDIAKCETFKNFTTLKKALLFLIKLNKTAVQSVSKILKRHYDITFKQQLRNLQNLVCKVARQERAYNLIKTCIIYKLIPKFLPVKLYKNQSENWRKTCSFRRAVLSHELTDQQKLLTHTRSELIKEPSDFCSQFGIVSAWKINSFLLN